MRRAHRRAVDRNRGARDGMRRRLAAAIDDARRNRSPDGQQPAGDEGSGGDVSQLGVPASPKLEDIDQFTYRLAPGDLIDVKFPYHPEENERVPVRRTDELAFKSPATSLPAGSP